MSEELIKVAVLEQKLMDFSNVVSKIDDAITKLSDVNANITKMLAVHEERIEQCNKSDNLIIKMIDTLKLDNTKEHEEVVSRIEVIEKEVKEVGKIKWMTVGSGVILAILTAAISSLASGWWTPSEMKIDRGQTHTHSNLPQNK